MSAPAELVPVMEIGGTHVTTALIAASEPVPFVVEQYRMHIDADGSAQDLVESFSSAAASMHVTAPTTWGVAIPGPFDYERGIGLFRDVEKFESLNGFDLGDALIGAITPKPRDIRFLNDADAFGLGEYTAGAARHHDRAVCLTLGTGVGSAFIADGTPVNDGTRVPTEGSAYTLVVDGGPLEDTVSRRAIRRHYEELTGEPADVHIIARRARRGEKIALAVLDNAMRALGEAIGPWVLEFGATVVVVGGSISGSWDLLERPLRTGLIRADRRLATLDLLVAEVPDDAPLIGAAAAVHRPFG